jgi:hypothetical protein
MTGQNTTLSVTSYNNRLYSVRIEGNVTGTADIEASAGVDALVVQGGTLTVSQGLDTAVYAGRVKVTSGGKLTGAGSMTFGSGVGIPTYAGTIDISTITIQANGGHTFAAGTYGTYMLFDQGWGTSITFTGDTTFTKSVYMLADISGQSFVVQNNTNNPTLTFNRNLTLAESGNGITWTKGTGQLLFSSNTANQTVNFLGKSVESVVSSNTASGGLTFISSFTTPSLYVNASGLSSAATVYFAGNSTFTISTFTVTGSAANHVVLKSTDSSQWFLSNTSSHTVAYVEVSSSNANGSFSAINAYTNPNFDRGNNTNWDFVGLPPDVGVRYWVAATEKNWQDPTAWSTASGGVVTGGVPVSSHTVIFDGNGSGRANLVGLVSVATLTFSGYTSTFTSQGYNIIVSSYFSQSSGWIVLSTSNITIQGDFLRTGGTYYADASTIGFTGNGVQNLNPGATSFFNFIIASVGSNVQLNSNLDVNGDFTQLFGTFNQNTSTVNVAGNLSIGSGATLNKASGAQWLIFDGTGTIADSHAAGSKQDLGRVRVSSASDSAVVTRTLASEVKMSTLTIDAGTIFSLNGSTLAFAASSPLSVQ